MLKCVDLVGLAMYELRCWDDDKICRSVEWQWIKDDGEDREK